MAELTYQGRNTPDQVTVYYSGTDPIKVGYLLCYDTTATESGTTNATRLGTAVVKPATANLNLPAGVAAEAKTGPCYIRIQKLHKGIPIQAMIKANATLASTLLGGVNGQYELGAIAQSGADLPVIAIAMVTKDTSATAELHMALPL